ncbi:discoidin domain-containing protein [Nocardioides sp. WS12]|uniref:discoidin domain-containing protein n=1 Tax=Nocardioides sp. WS12 TaxID=2486272 RepID=UPI0015F8A5D4|nr:discoidin domain-containing protein [Nocardioides sp. WS12]
MSTTIRRRALALLAALPMMTAAPAVAAETTPLPGPALVTPTATLQSALNCSSDVATATKTPILLITGTIESPLQSWSWGYQKVLREQGYPVCTVSLPNGGTGDMQTTVEYVVNAIRSVHTTAGRKISLVGHSQGGLLPAWGLKYWPDLADYVDDAVLLDAPVNGSDLGRVCDFTHSCPALAWDIVPGSNWTRALTRSPLSVSTSVTTVGAGNTDLIVPGGAATKLNGATNFVVGNLCPGRYVSHLDMLGDNVAYELTMDALTHTGPASWSRVSGTACSRTFFPGIDAAAKTSYLDLIGDVIDALFDAAWVPAEPPLRDYAIGLVGDTNLSLNKPVTTSSNQSSSYVGSKAVDGSHGTRWSSAPYQALNWIYVDLGATKTVTGVQLGWEKAYANDYSVQVWDGTAWRTIYSTGSGDGGNDFIPLADVSTRFIMVQMTYRGSGYGNYSLWEMTVAGH